MKIQKLLLAFVLSLFLLPSFAFAQAPGHDNVPISITSGNWRFAFGGYLRTGFEWLGVDGETLPDGVYANNGFGHFQARMIFDLAYASRLKTRISVDGAGSVATVDGGVRQNIDLKDAYFDFMIAPEAHVRLGQFKTPLDFEARLSEPQSFFIRNSIVSNGAKSVLGVQTPMSSGFSPGRQIGLGFYADDIEIGPISLLYHLSITNGSSAQQIRSSENFFATHARFGFKLSNSLLGSFKPGYFLTVSGGFSYTLTDLSKDRSDNDKEKGHVWTTSAEISANFLGINVDLEAMFKQFEERLEGTLQTQTLQKFGLVTQIAYSFPFEHLRFQLGYRFGWLKPLETGASSYAKTSLYQHSIMFGYVFEEIPLTLRMEYSHNTEDKIFKEGDFRTHNNDSLFAIAQVVW